MRNQRLTTILLSPESYDISVNGFLPEDLPLSRLEGGLYQPLERLASRLSCGDKNTIQFRQEVEALSARHSDWKALSDQTKRIIQRIYTVCSFASHVYVWGYSPTDEVLTIIPRGLGIPWVASAAALGLPCVITHAATDLWNYSLKSMEKGFTLDNLRCNLTFTGSSSEEWFYLITTAIEHEGAWLIHSCFSLASALSQWTAAVAKARSAQVIIPTIESPNENQVVNLLDGDASNDQELHDKHPVNYSIRVAEAAAYPVVESFLIVLKQTMCNITSILDRMYENCDPKHFFNHQRRFLCGFGHTDSQPDGVSFEGISACEAPLVLKRFGACCNASAMGVTPCELPKAACNASEWLRLKVKGASAGQSSTMQLLDILLGIEHKDEQTRGFAEEVRYYMPTGHRAFLKDIETVAALLRQYLIGENTMMLKLTNLFKSCIEELASFRRHHYGLINTYILAQTVPVSCDTKDLSFTDCPSSRGTGGTELVRFLKQLIEETQEAKLFEPSASLNHSYIDA